MLECDLTDWPEPMWEIMNGARGVEVYSWKLPRSVLPRVKYFFLYPYFNYAAIVMCSHAHGLDEKRKRPGGQWETLIIVARAGYVSSRRHRELDRNTLGISDQLIPIIIKPVRKAEWRNEASACGCTWFPPHLGTRSVKDITRTREIAFAC